MTKEEIIKFSKHVYGGTTYSHKMKLVAYNSDYVLMQKPPSTEYIGRMSPTVYSQSEWFLISVLSDKTKISYDPESVSVFYKKGKLLKSEKEMLKSKYKIEFPKKEKNKKEVGAVWVVLYKRNEFWNTYPQGFFKFYKLIRQNESSVFIQTNSGDERVLSKSMYNIAYFKDDKEALNSFLKLERLAKEYNDIIKSSANKSREIEEIFTKNKSK